MEQIIGAMPTASLHSHADAPDCNIRNIYRPTHIFDVRIGTLIYLSFLSIVEIKTGL